METDIVKLGHEVLTLLKNIMPRYTQGVRDCKDIGEVVLEG